jgi:hypothetical protein
MTAAGQKRPTTHTIPCTRRYRRYNASPTTRSLKCHGVFWGGAITVLHVGHDPSAFIEFGFQNLLHDSHHGIS